MFGSFFYIIKKKPFLLNIYLKLMKFLRKNASLAIKISKNIAT